MKTDLVTLCRFAHVDPEDLAAGGPAGARAQSRIHAARVFQAMGISEKDTAPLIRLCERARVDPQSLAEPGLFRELGISNLRLFAAREEAGAPQWRSEPKDYNYDEPPDSWGITELRRKRQAGEK